MDGITFPWLEARSTFLTLRLMADPGLIIFVFKFEFKLQTEAYSAR